jgi:sugar/nucleoside kinase (ribokinase family)
MPSHAFRVHGAGSGLADWIHGPVDFASPRIDPYRSRASGDGGLAMGKVTFREDLLALAERRRALGEPARTTWEEILADILGPDASAPAFNVGGPALASLTLAAQLLRPARVPVTYYGASGDDAEAARIRHTLAQTPMDMTCYRRKPGPTTAAHVFPDPKAGGGAGDRFFVHCQGADAPMDDVFNGETFFQAVFNVYAGTVQVPSLHRALPSLLAKSRRRGALTVVGAVYDHATEKSAPGRPWPLGGEGEESGREAWGQVDLLVADAAELAGLAGLQNGATGSSIEAAASIEAGVQTLFDLGLGAAVVTQGEGPVYYRSLGGPFGECRGWARPHPDLIAAARDPRNTGDTSGAGDNFLGALIADLMHQILADDFYPKGEPHVDRELLSISPLRLRRAIDFACVAGGLACRQRGGVRLESAYGENLGRIRAYMPQAVPAGRPW